MSLSAQEQAPNQTFRNNFSRDPATAMYSLADYTTNFSATENPISEGGIWANGASTGLDWKNVRTSGGVAFGTQTGTDIYRDSTALLLGTWSPDQSVTGVVHTVNQTDAMYQEVEFRLRSTLAPHVNSGYEVLFRCHDENQYVEIVRWNGPAGDFDFVARTMGPGISDGDTLKAEIIGTTIRVYINGALVLKGSDSTFATGNPGIGFYLQGGSSETNSDFGFYSITATGGNPPGRGDQTAPSVPTNPAATAVGATQVNVGWTASTDNVGVMRIPSGALAGCGFRELYSSGHSDGIQL